MKHKAPQSRKADEKSNYKKDLDQIGSQSNFAQEDTNLLKQMYVGKKNAPNTKTAGMLELDESEVDNPPVQAVDREYPDEGYDSDETEKSFFVDESNMETEGLNKLVDLQKTFTNPAGVKDTAPRQTDTSIEVSAKKEQPNKEQARQSAREVQAKIANAKNLAELMYRKSLVAREQVPGVAKLAVQLDSKSFGLLKKIVEAVNTVESQGRKATAAVADKGLQTPIHVARANVKGSKFQDEFSDAPWDGVPPSGYDHSKHASH